MNEKEISELRRRFRADRSNITHIHGCYVNEAREIVSEFDQSLAMMDEEETERFFALLKKCISGSLGKNLMNMDFTTQQVVDSDEHRLLMKLRSSKLEDQDAVHEIFQRISEAVSLSCHYLILLAYDTYDVYFSAKDGQRMDDASSEVYSYILCGVYPIKMTKPALSFFVSENEFHNLSVDRLICPPEMAFLFPAFDDRCANLYSSLYYTKNPAETHPEFIEAVFHREAPMSAQEQKETFRSILCDSLSEECSLDVIKNVHTQLREMEEEHKAKKEPEPLMLSRSNVAQVLQNCGVDQEHITAFEEKYTEDFGEDTDVSPRNLVDLRQLEVRTPNVVIRVDPDRSDLIETRVIDGVKYLLIRADEGVEVNGASICISQPQEP